MGCFSCVTDLSREKKCSIFLRLWAGIGGIVALTLNDENACVELRQMMMVTGIGPSAFSICYLGNCFFLERGFPYLLLCTLFFVALMEWMWSWFIQSMPLEMRPNWCRRIVVTTIEHYRSLWFRGCIILLCCMLKNNDNFYSQNTRDLKGEFQTLLL